MIDSKVNEFIIKYNELIKSDEYIGLKKYNEFLNLYYNYIQEDIKKNKELQDIINDGYISIEKHNKEYIEKELIKEKEYFDNIFRNIDDKIYLDEEQRKAILCDEDYSLIIAGAGAGKTTTMAAKVKYLIEKKKINPNKIVVISYTNKATEELEDRIKYDFDLPVDIMTFHSLGIKIIRKIFNKPLKPVSEIEQIQIIIEYFKEVLFKNKRLLNEYIRTFNKYRLNDSQLFAKGFVENYHKFNNFNDYFTDYKKRKLEKEKNNLKEVIDYYENYFLKLSNPKSLKGEITKSMGEARIANFLFKNGIDYKYESPYPERVDIERTYLPDFTIEINGIPTYIEYYGLSNYKGLSTLSEKEEKKYQAIREKKRAFHKLNNNNYIELDYHKKDTNQSYLEVLKDELIKRGAKLKYISDEEIYNAILDTNESAEFFRFIKFILSIIETIKSSLDRNRINDKIINYINKSKVSKEEKEEMLKESNLIIKIYNYYQKQLLPRNQIDFADMIYYANRYLQNIENKDNKLDYEYIIIDEYQDISISRYYLARNLSLITDAKVISVGDDWQTIFSFAGSRIDLFYKYQDLFPGAKNLQINHTYRNSQQLINIAGRFITKNPYQIKKNLISDKTRNAPIKIVFYDNNQFLVLGKLIEKIYEENPNDSIMILSRKNKTIKNLKEDLEFEEGLGERIIYKKCPNAFIEAMSIHKAKGLGADQVIILNVTAEDFPCLENNKYWLNNLFCEKKFNENFPDAEERRVFYVALTRTKNDVYLLTPKNEVQQSKFIKELLEYN